MDGLHDYLLSVPIDDTCNVLSWLIRLVSPNPNVMGTLHQFCELVAYHSVQHS